MDFNLEECFGVIYPAKNAEHFSCLVAGYILAYILIVASDLCPDKTSNVLII